MALCFSILNTDYCRYIAKFMLGIVKRFFFLFFHPLFETLQASFCEYKIQSMLLNMSWVVFKMQHIFKAAYYVFVFSYLIFQVLYSNYLLKMRLLSFRPAHPPKLFFFPLHRLRVISGTGIINLTWFWIFLNPDTFTQQYYLTRVKM